MSFSNKNLIWIDLEMTGLDPKNNKIIEIATLITDNNLNILAEGPNLVIYQKKKYLDRMNKWNFLTHSSTGLIQKVRKSLINVKEAELITLNFLKKWIPKKVSPICGNTIGQDRRFLFEYMPDLEDYFHYRYLDVSTLRELVIRWMPNIMFLFQKKNKHTALSDIKESVNELIFYRKYFLNISV